MLGIFLVRFHGCFEVGAYFAEVFVGEFGILEGGVDEAFSETSLSHGSKFGFVVLIALLGFVFDPGEVGDGFRADVPVGFEEMGDFGAAFFHGMGVDDDVGEHAFTDDFEHFFVGDGVGAFGSVGEVSIVSEGTKASGAVAGGEYFYFGIRVHTDIFGVDAYIIPVQVTPVTPVIGRL